MAALLLAGCSATPSRTAAGSFDPERVMVAADGRRYRVERVLKTPGSYVWTGTDTVRYYPFAIYVVDRQDDQYLYVRQYLPTPSPPPRPATAEAIDSADLATSSEFAVRDFGTGLPRSGQRRGRFAIADMNADGHPDLVLPPARKTLGVPIILLGDGLGGWQPWRGLTFPAIGFDYGSVAVADFNADNIPDIAIGMHLRGLAVLTGDGKGDFSLHGEGLPLGQPAGATPLRWSTRNIAAFDWNGDGRSDLLAIDEHLLGSGDAASRRQAGVSVFINEGDQWNEAPLAGLESTVPMLTLAMVAGSVPSRWVALSRNGGAQARVLETGKARWRASPLDGVPADAILRTVAAADLDGDSSTDLVVSYQLNRGGRWFNAIDALYVDGNGHRRRAVYRQEAREPIMALALGHFRLADRWDLAVADAEGRLMLFAGDGKGFFRRDLVVAADAWRQGCGAADIQARDLDGDGIDEIIAAFAGESSALDLQPRCVAGGGLQAWKLDPPVATRP